MQSLCTDNTPGVFAASYLRHMIFAYSSSEYCCHCDKEAPERH